VSWTYVAWDSVRLMLALRFYKFGEFLEQLSDNNFSEKFWSPLVSYFVNSLGKDKDLRLHFVFTDHII
jgi:hypothetical protein